MHNLQHWQCKSLQAAAEAAAAVKRGCCNACVLSVAQTTVSVRSCGSEAGRSLQCSSAVQVCKHSPPSCRCQSLLPAGQTNTLRCQYVWGSCFFGGVPHGRGNNVQRCQPDRLAGRRRQAGTPPRPPTFLLSPHQTRRTHTHRHDVATTQDEGDCLHLHRHWQPATHAQKHTWRDAREGAWVRHAASDRSRGALLHWQQPPAAHCHTCRETHVHPSSSVALIISGLTPSSQNAAAIACGRLERWRAATTAHKRRETQRAVRKIRKRGRWFAKW